MKILNRKSTYRQSRQYQSRQSQSHLSSCLAPHLSVDHPTPAGFLSGRMSGCNHFLLKHNKVFSWRFLTYGNTLDILTARMEWFDTRPTPYMLEQAHKSQCNNVPTLIFINVVQEENPPSNQQPLWAFLMLSNMKNIGTKLNKALNPSKMAANWR